MKNKDIFSKSMRKYKAFLIFYLAFVVLTFSSVIIGVIVSKQEVKATYLNDLIVKGDYRENNNARLDIYYEPIVFASYGEKADGKFYIVNDKNFFYIAFLTTEEYDSIMKIDDLFTTPYTIYGVTKLVDKDIKKFAMDEYNKLFNYIDESKENKEFINDDNFVSLLGGIYIDTTTVNTGAETYYLLALATGLIAGIGLLSVYTNFNSSKRNYNSLSDKEKEKVINELNNDKTILLKSKNLWLTEHYIVFKSNGVYILKYSDLVWIYSKKDHVGILKYTNCLIGVVATGKKRTILEVDTLGKKNEELFKNAYDLIAAKNKKIIKGRDEKAIMKAKDKYNIG